MYAHIFENKLTGVSRNIFWSITLEFEPIRYAQEDWECSMTCEWIPWQIRDWRGLQDLDLKVRSDDPLIESSFYMVQHHRGKETELLLQRHEGNLFKVRMAMIVDFTGFTGKDKNPDMFVSGETIVPFKGLFVVPDNLFPKPATVAEVKDIAREYIEPAAYHEPYKEKHRFIFEPVV